VVGLVFYDPLLLFVVFLVAVWLAAKLVLGGDGWAAMVVLAIVFAFLLPGMGYLMAVDAWAGLAALVVAVGAAQWLFKATLAESIGVVAVAWLVGSLLAWGF